MLAWCYIYLSKIELILSSLRWRYTDTISWKIVQNIKVEKYESNFFYNWSLILMNKMYYVEMLRI